jgi:sulfiredoxin
MSLMGSDRSFENCEVVVARLHHETQWAGSPVSRFGLSSALTYCPHRDAVEQLRLIQSPRQVEGVRMLKTQVFQIATIHVPVKRAKTLDMDKVSQIAESILEEGQLAPIQVRADGDRFVLVEGLHRLEAMKALGESTINGYLVQARMH